MEKITEDYCSYEVAKLLKEKGFDWDCEHYYKPNGEIAHTFHTNGSHHINSSVLYEHQCLAPTQAMAIKWLRVEKYIIIFIMPTRDDIGNFSYCYDIALWNEEEGIYEMNHMSGWFYTYEEAVEAALKYCLTKLI